MNDARSAAASGRGPGSPRSIAPEPYLRIGFLVHDASRIRRTLFDHALKPLGITRSQWLVLANLSRQVREGMTQSDLAHLLELGKVTVGGLIDRLEASGHVERHPDPIDRRVKRILITDKGYELIDQLSSVARDLNEDVLKGIPVEHVLIAEEVMSRMKDNMRALLRSTPAR
jgi:DNA-binding MarR family transcriptional regulator